MRPPYVLMVDGLAAGKRIITSERKEAEQVLWEMLEARPVRTAGERVAIEQFLMAWNSRPLAITDGSAFKMLPSAKDYKRVGDGDTGPNTGAWVRYPRCPSRTRISCRR